MISRKTTPARCNSATVLALLAWIPSVAATAGASGAATKVDFNRDIRPILSDNCFACHGPDPETRKAKLRLDTQKGALSDLGGYRAVVPGQADKSEVYRRITSPDRDEVMPPPDSHKRLTVEQIELVNAWISQGASWQPHWSLVPAEKPAVPVVKSARWARNPIDVFVAARFEAAGLSPSSEASKETLVRRVSLDLTGLPPTPAEVDAFLTDHRSDAYERLVDRLLASPRYGEHQARTWLDAARYADTDGLSWDSKRAIWPYRDWVVQAFNRNMPYDRFTIEQLAGDLLPTPTRDQLVATGFLRSHMTTNESGTFPEEALSHIVRDRVETFSAIWLGLTTGCAACHDHKYDPVTQKDFYQLSAYFDNGTDPWIIKGENITAPPPFLLLGTPEQEKELARLDAELASARAAIKTALENVTYVEPLSAAAAARLKRADRLGRRPPIALRGKRRDSILAWELSERHKTKGTRGTDKDNKIPAEISKILAKDSARRTEGETRQLRDHFFAHIFAGAAPIFAPLHAQTASLEKQRATLDGAIPRTLVFAERPQRRQTHVLIRGEYDRKGEAVSPATPSILPRPPKGTPPNRLGLARWLTDPGHPLVARVAANRLWQQHFGTGIVKTSWDFGVQGEWPANPELLDWLATTFVASGWNVKALHRLILTSATYRQSSRLDRQKLDKDPENRLLSRGPRFRLDGEVLRDNALYVSGLLVERMGGPGVRPYQPGDLWKEVSYPGSDTDHFVQDTGDALYRRSIYTFWKRTAPPPAIATFDAPSREICTVRRERTNTPLQALVLMNDPQFVEAARKLGERTMREGGTTPDERITWAFRLVLARRPSARALEKLKDLFVARLAAFRADDEAARALLEVGDSAPVRDLPPAELAAWTMVGSALLNLDETLTN